MPILSIDQILAANDIPEEVVEIPEWGGAVKVRGLSRAAYDALDKEAEVVIPATGPGQEPKKKRDAEKFSDLLFLACVAEPKFGPEHLPALRDKSLSALNRVFEAIGRVLKTDVKAQAETKSEPGEVDGSAVRDGSGAGPGDDAGGAPAGDVNG